MASARMQPDFDCDHDGAALSLEQALEQTQRYLRPVDLCQRLTLKAALGRVLGEEVVSPLDVPAHDNSAMDGYAVRAADLPPEGETTLLGQVGTAFAGHPFEGQVGAGQCVRIMTGAVVPAGADTIVIQEHTQTEEGGVRMPGGYVRGQHVRRAGEDLARGRTVLTAGHRLIPADLGLLASLGIADVSVVRRLRVACFSTGDELRSAGEVLGAGEIYDSNRYSLHGMLSRLDCEVLDMGVVRDDLDALRHAFAQAGANADVVITSGGVSVGEADHIRTVLAELGEVGFWKVSIKPGKPLAFGRLGDAVFFGLPGNPVSVMVTFYKVVQPALMRLRGEMPQPTLQLRARATAPLRKKPGRREFQRGRLFNDESGALCVEPASHQGSGVLRSMSEANCFIVLSEETGALPEGSDVVVEPFSQIV